MRNFVFLTLAYLSDFLVHGCVPRVKLSSKTSKFWCGSARRAVQVESCSECGPELCRMRDITLAASTEYRACYWNEDIDKCVSNRDLKMWCGEGRQARDCAGCGGRPQCGGECHWLEEAGLCVHVAVHSIPPFYSLTSDGLTKERFPNVLGVYSLSQTDIRSQVISYSLLHDRTKTNQTTEFYMVKDFSVPTLEYVTRTPFSRDDSVLYHNETGWFLTVHRHVGGVQYVAEPSIEMESMATREDHDCVLGDWEAETNCSKSCGGGTLTLTRRIIKNNRGHGLACSGDNTRRHTCNDFICPGLVVAILLFPLLLFLSAAISVIFGFKWKYDINIPSVFFAQPDHVTVSNKTNV